MKVDMAALSNTPVQENGKHILYVDDEESLVLLMKRLLMRQGFRVSSYTDPQEALDAWCANPAKFDVAVADYNMPGMSGLVVARTLCEIRAKVTAPDTGLYLGRPPSTDPQTQNITKL